MRIYAIRHGQTHMNLNNLLNSQLDDGLTEEGMKQARQAAKTIPKSVQRIYASSLRRTRQTAEIVNEELKLPLAFHDELMEVNFGSLSGAEYSGEKKVHHLAMDYDWHQFGGESVDDVKKRVIHMLDAIKAESGDGEALIVAHGGIIRMLYYLEAGKHVEQIDNGSLHSFDLDKILANQ